MKKKKILFVSSEAAPFITTGGLGEVVGSLPKYLMEQDKNIDVRIILPLYEEVASKFKDKLELLGSTVVSLNWRKQYCGIFTAKAGKVTYYFIDNEYYFKRADCYGHFDDGERFAFFGKAVMDILGYIGFIPDIMHMHDWQSAIAAIYLRTTYKDIKELKKIKTVFTVHNIEYQGKYDMSILHDVFDIPFDHKNTLEFDGAINLMKGAMTCSDIISTVSPSYAEEIHDCRSAHGLDPIINMRTKDMRGILNGIDTDSYNPATDDRIFTNFDADSPGKKIDNKIQLQTIMNLPAQDDMPLIGVITRLVSHKGIDLITGAMNELVELPVQFIVLGSGDRGYELSLESFAERFPDKIAIKVGFNNELARRIYAGADMLLMPSRSEPCGISQMIAARYGTVPLVRETGGLKDSIIPYETDGGSGIGFTFTDYRSDSIVELVNRAAAVYKDTEKWNE
ncbi:MAG: glycogen synthase, partial [Oscillospiraceae bacterium]|nr:glycogen synthase [Oscillospiraceae bacterium]